MTLRLAYALLGLMAGMAAVLPSGSAALPTPPLEAPEPAPQSTAAWCLAQDATSDTLCRDLCAHGEVGAIMYESPGARCLVRCDVALAWAAEEV